MRMVDSLPKGCNGEKTETENGEQKRVELTNLGKIKNRGVLDSDSDDDDDNVGENGEAKEVEKMEEGVEEEEKEYVMTKFNFRKANNWFKAIDLLKVDLSLDPAMKHFLPTGWHPPLPCPPRRTYPPTADILPETPKGDQTWSDTHALLVTITIFLPSFGMVSQRL